MKSAQLDSCHSGPHRRPERSRRGIVAALTALLLVVMFGFAAFAVDGGYMVLAKTNLQNAMDAASLAASQEIVGAVEEAGEQQGGVDVDANSIAIQNARQVAVEVALANGVTIDPQNNVAFGKRVYDEASDTWPILWGEAPFNVVAVSGELPIDLSFGWAVGKDSVTLQASSTAFVEARDMVLVLDFSGSMSDDSELDSPVGHNLDDIWDTLVADNPTFPDTRASKFPSGGFGLINSYAGTHISGYSDDDDIFDALELADDDAGTYVPFPQAGTHTSGSSEGLPKNQPNASTSKSKWKAYIRYVRDMGGDYNRDFGYRTLMHYLLLNGQMKHKTSEDLWRTPHYPFHAVKNGASLFIDFIEDLDFGDEIGLVSYDGHPNNDPSYVAARVEDKLNDGDAIVDISSDPISNDYTAVDTIQRHKQAGHYDVYTGMGWGVKEAKELLDNHVRHGARPTIILMTDGNANRYPSDFSLPSDWDWAELTDYDGDGSPDYTTSDMAKAYAFYEAREAFDAGYTVHTMSVGANADRNLMEAIAFACGGTWINVPGGATIADMEEQLRDAFSNIAANVPPPKLVYQDDSGN